jgi:hypothetical protein
MVVKVRAGPGCCLLGRGRRTVDRQGDEDQNNLNIQFNGKVRQWHLRMEPIFFNQNNN